MTTTFCFDFGNTRKKLAIFKDDQIAEIIILDGDTSERVTQLIHEWHPQKSILSTVIEDDPRLEELLSKHTAFHKLNHQTKLPFTTPVGKPETIGADRLALIASAVHFYPAKHNLIIALGTCITYNFVNKQHEFLGGGISPGLEIRLKSLNHYTAKLPVVKADSNLPLIGYDTASNILSGVILGMAYEIEGFIAEYESKFGNFNVVLTGGDIVHLGSHLKKKIFADPELIFKGLYAISQVNNS